MFEGFPTAEVGAGRSKVSLLDGSIGARVEGVGHSEAGQVVEAETRSTVVYMRVVT